MNPSSDPTSGPSRDHYFSEDPSSASRRREFPVRGRSGDLVLEAESGVFSQHGLDKGTAVLLDHMDRFGHPHLEAGISILDLGCGSGAIALHLASHYPDCSVIAVDVNERARQLCRRNAERNGLTNVTVIAPDDIDPSLTFGMIWSNPPIRIGKEALHELLSHWLGRLAARGRAHLVVSKNLGADSLMDWLKSTGFVAAKLASSKGFRILEISRPVQ